MGGGNTVHVEGGIGIGANKGEVRPDSGGDGTFAEDDRAAEERGKFSGGRVLENSPAAAARVPAVNHHVFAANHRWFHPSFEAKVAGQAGPISGGGVLRAAVEVQRERAIGIRRIGGIQRRAVHDQTLAVAHAVGGVGSHSPGDDIVGFAQAEMTHDGDVCAGSVG